MNNKSYFIWKKNHQVDLDEFRQPLQKFYYGGKDLSC